MLKIYNLINLSLKSRFDNLQTSPALTDKQTHKQQYVKIFSHASQGHLMIS